MEKESKVQIILRRILFTFIFIFILITTSSFWSMDTFGIMTFNQVLFTLQLSVQGTDIHIYILYFLKALLPAILVFVLFHYIKRILKKKENKIFYYIYLTIVFIFSFWISFIYIDKAWGISQFASGLTEKSTFIEENYVDPRDVNITFPKKKRNLLHIYIESMETSYGDKENGGVFDKSRIPELTNLGKENITFSRNENDQGAYTTYGTTWTIAGMLGQTSGIPLNVGGGEYKPKKFLPGIYNLGDILEENGYENHIILGSEKKFAGRDKFFTQHGSYNIYDLNWALENDMLANGANDFWGIDDEELFELSKERLNEISKKDTPFNFTILTVDSHSPKGYLSENSSDEYEDQYSNVLRGESKMVTDFVKWCMDQDWYENTTILLTGDHFTMSSNYIDDELRDKRGVYNAIINMPDDLIREDRLKNRNFTTMDFFPTTIYILGGEIKGDRLGLGTNLFSDEKTLSEIYSNEVLDREFMKKSEFYTYKFIK